MGLLSDPTITDLSSVQRNFDQLSRYLHRGRGSPEGVVSAVVGAHYQREDGGAATSFYVKELAAIGGNPKMGWVGK